MCLLTNIYFVFTNQCTQDLSMKIRETRAVNYTANDLDHHGADLMKSETLLNYLD